MKARARQAQPAAGVRANVEALTPAPLPRGEGWNQLGASTDRGRRSQKIPSPTGRGWRAAPGEGVGVRANVEALTPAPLPVGEGCKQLGLLARRERLTRNIPSPPGRGWRAAPGEGVGVRANVEALTPAPLPRGERCKVESARCALPLIPSPPVRSWRVAPGEGLSAPRLAPSTSHARASDAPTPAPLPAADGMGCGASA